MPPKVDPIEERVMIIRARDAITKVDRHGKRGLTLLSMDELEAVILMLVCKGVMPWHDADLRTDDIPTPEGDPR